MAVEGIKKSTPSWKAGKKSVSKHQIQLERGEGAGWRGAGRPNPSRETKFSGVNVDSENIIFLFS